MRKELILPGLAVGGGAVGFFLRRWELATAFEADSGLAIPHMPATWALIAFSAAIALALALLCRGKHRPFALGYDAAFSAKGNTLYVTASVLSAFLSLASAGLNCLGLPAAYQSAVETAYQARAANVNLSALFSLLPRALLALLCAATFFCLLSLARNNYRGGGHGKYSAPLLAPAYAGCVWLIAAYQVRAGDPVTLDYVYELLAIAASLLGFYFIAGFSFEKAKPFRTAFFSLLGVYFSIVTLADAHPLYVTLLYVFTALCLAANSAVLLFNDRQIEPEGPRMPQPTAETEEIETEGTPDD